MIRRMATLLGGSVTGQLLAILSAFILTRLYGPEAFAHLEMFALVTGIAAVLGTGKFEQALMLPKGEDEARALFSAGQRAVGLTIMAVYVVSVLTAHWVADAYGLEGWVTLAYVLPLFAGIAAHTRLLEYWRHRQTRGGMGRRCECLGAGRRRKRQVGYVWHCLSSTGLVWGSGAGLVLRWAVMRRGLSGLIRGAWSLGIKAGKAQWQNTGTIRLGCLLAVP